MTPEEWKKVSAALNALNDLAEERRTPYLQRLAAEDPFLCREVESLLKQPNPTERLDASPPQLLETLRLPAGDGVGETIGRLLDRQRAAWRRGERVPVEALVADHPALRDDRERLLDLVQNELDLRAAAGEAPRLEEYGKRFPELGDDLRKQFEVFAALGTADRTPVLGDCGAGPPATPRLEGYEILGELARGGMGVVYMARQTGLNRLVAVKMILARAHAGPEDRARFQTEAEAAACLRHPNIVQVFEVGEHDGLAFLSLEFLEGGSLAQQIARTPPTARAAAETVETLARAVHYAHSRGVIHRDLKPANVLLTVDGTPKIADFGLAKMTKADSGQTKTGEILGTPSYMAPEQAAPGPSAVGPPADVYALGAILYELLTGRPPFRGDTPWEVLTLAATAEPAPPRKLRPTTPADLQTICLKCLQKEPQSRYSSAEALADDLRRFLTDRPIAARPAGAAERSWRWGRRNPVLAAAAVVAAAAVAAAAAVSVGFGVYQSYAADALRREQTQTKAAEVKAEGLVSDLQETERQRVRLSRLSARLVLDQGQTRCEQGDVAAGLLSLAHGLEVVPDDAPGLAYSIRIAIGAWRGRLRPLRAVLPQEDALWGAQFRPDGKVVLTRCRDGTARLWDAATGRPVGEPMRHPAGVACAVFSPGGDRLLTGSDRTAQVWDAGTGAPIGGPFRHDAGVTVAAFSPDGQTVLTGSYDHTARLWDAATRRLIGKALEHPGGAVRAVSFSPDGKTVLTSGDDGTARLWGAADGEPVGEIMRHQGPVVQASFSPDGKRVMTAGSDGVVRLWDAVTGKPLRAHPLQHAGGVSVALFSPDGKTILTGSFDDSARLWEAATGLPKGRPMPHRSHIGAAAFSPDGKTVLTGSEDRTARLWDADTGEPLGPPLLHRETVSAVAFSPDGKTVLTASLDHAARLWEATTREQGLLVLPHPRPVAAVAYAPDGKTVLTACYDGKARCWDAVTGAPTGGPLSHRDRVYAVAFSPNGKTILTASWDGTARLWDAATHQPTGPVFRQDGPLFAAVFSPDGKTILTAGGDARSDGDHTARLWNAATGDAIGAPMKHDAAIWGAAFSPDGGTIATAGYDRTVRLWDAQTGVARDSLPHPGPVWGLAFSPDGGTLLTACLDRTARLWDLAAGRLTGAPLPHLDWVNAVDYAADGRTVLTGSTDRTARLWDPAAAQPLGPALTHLGAVNAVAYGPDGRTLMTGSLDGTARIWRRPTAVEGSAEQVVLWVQVITGLELDGEGVARGLEPPAWERRRQRLEALGGAPAW